MDYKGGLMHWAHRNLPPYTHILLLKSPNNDLTIFQVKIHTVTLAIVQNETLGNILSPGDEILFNIYIYTSYVDLFCNYDLFHHY